MAKQCTIQWLGFGVGILCLNQRFCDKLLTDDPICPLSELFSFTLIPEWYESGDPRLARAEGDPHGGIFSTGCWVSPWNFYTEEAVYSPGSLTPHTPLCTENRDLQSWWDHWLRCFSWCQIPQVTVMLLYWSVPVCSEQGAETAGEELGGRALSSKEEGLSAFCESK